MTFGVKETAYSKPLKTRMAQFLEQMMQLKKYSVSEKDFVEPKNAEDISRHLKEFSTLTQEAKHDLALSQGHFKFSEEVLNDHIVETERMFNSGNKYFARWRLAATVSICTSCHVQLPTNHSAHLELKDPQFFSSTFDQAEFLFSAHDFDQALGLYDKVLKDNTKTVIQDQNKSAALERELTYFIRVKRNPTMAIKRFELFQKNKNISESDQARIKVWIEQLLKIQKKKWPNPSTSSEKQLISYARDSINEEWPTEVMQVDQPELVPYLFVSGLLYEFLQSHPRSGATAEVLYWLAVCERSISDHFFYSLADLYLRECITQYPASNIASRCYSDYELEVMAGYAGSSGMSIPPEVRADLVRLKKKVEESKKINVPTP